MKKDADFFDETYFEKYDGKHKSNYTRVGGYARHAANVEWDQIAKDLAEEEEYVLDVGCAYGHLVKALRARGVNAFGIDVSEYAVSQAGSEFVWAHDIQDGVPAIPDRHPAKKWDLIVSMDVLEHCETKEEIRGLLAAMGKRSYRQIHKVNTGEYPGQAFGGDQSHGLALPLAEWGELAAEVEEETGCAILVTT
jgi:SAM-dependent methyltransferase